jgi:hypothetical protein
VGSVMSVIGLLWCGIAGGLLFSLEMTGGAGGVANFGAGLRVAYSSQSVTCLRREGDMHVGCLGLPRDARDGGEGGCYWLPMFAVRE